MKICYNEATMMKSSTLEKDLVLCEKAGFDFIEIRIDMLHEYLKTHTMDDLGRFFSSSRIKPHALNAVYIKKDFSLSDDRQREAFADEIKKISGAAQVLGAPSFIVVPPLNHDRVTPWGEPCEKVTEALAGTLKFIGEIAARYVVGVCFELVGAPYSSVRSIGHAKEIVERAGMENVGYVFDSYNIYLNRACTDYAAMAAVGVRKIFAVHINDAVEVPLDKLGPQANRRLCGFGMLPLGDYLTTLKDMGYDGMVSIETFCTDYYERTPEEIIPLAYESTKKLMLSCGCL